MIYIFCQYQAIVDILKHFYIFYEISVFVSYFYLLIAIQWRHIYVFVTLHCFPTISYLIISRISVPFFPHFLFLFSSILGRKCPSNRTQFLFVTYLKSGTSVIVLIVQYNNNYVWLNKFSLGCKNHSFYLYAPYNNHLMFSEKMVE